MGKGSVRNVMSDKRPYKVYTALLTQSGTDAPTTIILENTIGNIIWTRDNGGSYIGTLSNAFTENKTFTSIQGSNDGDLLSITSVEKLMRYDNSTVRCSTNYYDSSSTTPIPSDGYLNGTPIEIRVYH